MQGAKVYVNGDVLCGELDQSKFKNGANEWIFVKCLEEVEATSLSIVGEQGVSVCSVFTLNVDRNL